jgi:chorismate-pyruvate lyase
MVVVIPIDMNDFGINMLQRISDLESISHIKLGLFEKILLAETGTLEQVLTILTNSEVDVKILKQKEYHKSIKRVARIINKKTGEHLVYATSNILCSNLPEGIITQIKQKHLSIGSIIKNYQLETYRKILKIGYNSRARAVFRIYHIIYKGEVIFKIKEVFLLDARINHNSLNIG